MSITSYTIFLLIGLISGWFVYLAQRNRHGRFWLNLAIGVLGATIGGILFGKLDTATLNVIGEFAASIGGAIFLFMFTGFVQYTVKLFWKKTDSFN